jgi:hypothetical protein
MSQIPGDDDLRAMIRSQFSVIGLSLPDDEIELVLPSYRGFLANVQALEAVTLPVEMEPAHTFDLSPRREP